MHSCTNFLYVLLHCFVTMNTLTCSGLFRLQFLFRCLSLFPVALTVLSAYAFFFMYQRVLNTLLVRDGANLLGDDVAVPDRP